MEKLQIKLDGIVSGLLTAGAILVLTTWGAGRLLGSEAYNKSRIISMIVSQDSVGIADIAGDKRNVDMMLKFVGALTSAYINFELIPVKEAGTFAAVFESAQGEGGVEIEKFEYHRKNLTITGVSPEVEAYEEFLANLQETEYFESVTGHYYTTTDDRIRFELECASQTASVYLDFG